MVRVLLWETSLFSPATKPWLIYCTVKALIKVPLKNTYNLQTSELFGLILNQVKLNAGVQLNQEIFLYVICVSTHKIYGIFTTIHHTCS